MTSHHAVLLCSEHPLSYILELDYEIPTQDQYRLPQFGINDVRALTNHAHRRPDGEDATRVILVATEFITEEAQQALLKLIEEPPLSTKFVFVIPSGYSFLPTLESRFERVGGTQEVNDYTAFTTFKSASYLERLSSIEKSVKAKDHAWQGDIKRGLVAYLKESALKLPLETLRELEYVSRLLLTRGASNKFLLEHLALTLPL
jgi:DNA polymerase III delta prime subunit